MSALGQKRTFAPQKVTSALPPKADMCGALADVRFVPIADISTNTGTFDAAPAQGAPIFVIKPRVLLYSAIARSSPILFLWATPYAAAWARAEKLQ